MRTQVAATMDQLKPEVALRVFARRHGDCVAVKGALVYADGALRTADGTLLEPPTDDVARLRNVVVYLRSKLDAAASAFRDRKRAFTAAANALDDAPIPDPARAAAELHALRKVALKWKKAHAAAVAELEQITPNDDAKERLAVIREARQRELRRTLRRIEI